MEISETKDKYNNLAYEKNSQNSGFDFEYQ